MKISDVMLESQFDTDSIAYNIKRDCSEILALYQEMLGRALYRGLSSHLPFIESPIEQNRKPTQLSPLIQHEVDHDLFARGFKAVRGNSIFCAGARIAKSWGKSTYVVFPKNGFSYTWYPKFQQDYAWSEYSSLIYRAKSKLDITSAGSGLPPEHMAPVMSLVQGYIKDMHDGKSENGMMVPSQTDLKTALAWEREVMVTGEMYYGVCANTFNSIAEQILVKLGLRKLFLSGKRDD